VANTGQREAAAAAETLPKCGRKTNRRLDAKVERPDFISLMEKQGGGTHKDDLSSDEIHANASLLIIGGGDRTATILTGIANHLLQNPTSLRRLTDDLRSGF